MKSLGYLERLTLQLTAGAAYLPDEIRDPHIGYLLASQQQDGGWTGREGDSDLYYTSFALRSLAILGMLDGDVARNASNFLRRSLTTHQSLIDVLSLVYSAKLIEAACDQNPLEIARDDWGQRLGYILNYLRKADGGYGKTPEGVAGSTYQTFLVSICMELIEQPIPEADRVAKFLLDQRQADGGFLEIRVAKRSGANPTAAAIGALSTLNRLDVEIAGEAADFLVELQSDAAGFQANTRMPMPDVLSTFTSLVTLWDIDRIEDADLNSAYAYVLSMQRDGGFSGFELDPAKDVEYTFYGLGSLALLHPWVS